MKKSAKRNNIFQGTVGEAIQTYLNNDSQKLADEFWHSDAIITAVENADKAMKSLTVLRKHVPQHFHALIRFAQPNLTWYLNVEKGITATQLNMLLDDLLLRIARDIGYAPRLQVAVQPSALAWSRSGFPLEFPEKTESDTFDEDAAQAFINEFIST